MKAIFFQVFFFVLFLTTFIFFCFRFLDTKNPASAFDYKKELYNKQEEFDSSLVPLNTINKLENYCDSLFTGIYGQTTTADYQENYIKLAGSVIQKRFYWGYSSYSFNDNYLAVLFSKLTHWGYAAPVIPNDILKYPYAACSQQSIVMMELLKKRGISTRKVGFWGKSSKVGHFAFEAYYKNNWHFYDPTLEPDSAILNKYEQPGIEFIASNPEVLLAAYKNSNNDENYFLDLFPNYSYGEPDVFPAPNALLVHKVTKFFPERHGYFFYLAI